MTSELKVDKVSPATGTSTTLGDSGDTFTVPSGVTLDTSSSTLTLPSSVITGQTEKTSLVDADKFLVSDSAASGALKYVQKSNLGAGTHVKLLGGSASSAVTHNFGTFMDSSKYNVYMVQLSKVLGLQTNTFDFQFSDSGGEFNGAHYWGAVQGYRSGDATYVDAYENQTQGKLGSALSATTNTAGSYLFWIYQNANQVKMGSSVYGHNWGYRSDFGDYIFTDYSITYDATDDITGFEIHAAGNDATTFDYAIYGITK